MVPLRVSQVFWSICHDGRSCHEKEVLSPRSPKMSASLIVFASGLSTCCDSMQFHPSNSTLVMQSYCCPSTCFCAHHRKIQRREQFWQYKFLVDKRLLSLRSLLCVCSHSAPPKTRQTVGTAEYFKGNRWSKTAATLGCLLLPIITSWLVAARLVDPFVARCRTIDVLCYQCADSGNTFFFFLLMVLPWPFQYEFGKVRTKFTIRMWRLSNSHH